jgi:oxalate decarboxylase
MTQNGPQPIRGEKGASIIGPSEAQSRDRLVPPSTDQGTFPSLKWSFADCHKSRRERRPW